VGSVLGPPCADFGNRLLTKLGATPHKRVEGHSFGCPGSGDSRVNTVNLRPLGASVVKVPDDADLPFSAESPSPPTSTA
jgi:hypothetical protein